MEEDFDVRLGDEIKYYEPAPEYKKNAWTDDYERAYTEFLADPIGFWERQASHLEWFRPWDAVREWDYPYARWFVGARLNITHNCLDRHICRPPPQQGRPDLARRRGRGADLHLLQALARGEPVRERSPLPRRQEGRLRLHLHAGRARAGDRDARLRPDRRRPLGRLRWFRRSGGCDAAERCRGQGRDHGRHRVPARQADPADHDRRGCRNRRPLGRTDRNPPSSAGVPGRHPPRARDGLLRR